MNVPYGWTEDAYRDYLEYKRVVEAGKEHPDSKRANVPDTRPPSHGGAEEAFWEYLNYRDSLPKHGRIWHLCGLIQQPDVRAVMAGFFSFPRKAFQMKCIAPPFTTNYSTVGTAFDYLMRFLIRYHVPQAVDSPWVAYHGGMALKATGSSLAPRAEAMLERAEDAYNDFLAMGHISERLLICALQLAQLDAVYRAGWIDERLGETDAADVADLEHLGRLIPIEQFVGNVPCLLNPAFNRCHPINVRADADLIMSDAIIDIKVTKQNSMRLEFFRQLVGYYSLAAMGGFSYDSCSVIINQIGVYFARCGQLVTFDVNELRTDRPLKGWLEWLTARSFKG